VSQPELCPICGKAISAEHVLGGGDRYDYKCSRCGNFSISRTADSILRAQEVNKDPKSSSALSHAVFKMHLQSEWPDLSTKVIERILAEPQFPNPAEQADNLIAWLGENLEAVGEYRWCSVDGLQSAIGAVTAKGVRFVVRTVWEKGWLAVETHFDDPPREQLIGTVANDDTLGLTLTFDGWQRFEDLKRGSYDSRKAFMAMKFGDPQLDELFKGHLQPAVAATGFTLVKLDDNAPAGLIDDRLRVEIRTARFLLADLTHGNAGAYWEAGYAEGLGKPVIYLCRKDVFEDKMKSTHFDTNHHLTIPWDPADLGGAGTRLKTTIRATLPAEAKLED